MWTLILFCQVRCDKGAKRGPNHVLLDKPPAKSSQKDKAGSSCGAEAFPADSSDDEANAPRPLAPAVSSKAASSKKKAPAAAPLEERDAPSEKPPPTHKPEKWACKTCTLINAGRPHLRPRPR